MASVNKVILIGNLGRDPEFKHIDNGSCVCNFSIATTEKWRDKNTGDNQEKTEWHRVVWGGKQAEVAGKYLVKGSKVYVEGKLETRQWEDNDGNTRYTTEIRGFAIQFLDSKRSDSEAESSPEAESKPQASFKVEDDDIPF